MDPTEIQAKATIAAALISAHAVEVPAIPKRGRHGPQDQASVRLRELTDYVYDAIIATKV
jgi:hypothetical protein